MSKKSFFPFPDYKKHGSLHFGDGCSIKYVKEMVISNVPYLLDLNINILNLAKLDDQRCKMTPDEGFLI